MARRSLGAVSRKSPDRRPAGRAEASPSGSAAAAAAPAAAPAAPTRPRRRRRRTVDPAAPTVRSRGTSWSSCGVTDCWRRCPAGPGPDSASAASWPWRSGTAVFALPNETHRSYCEDVRVDVETALGEAFRLSRPPAVGGRRGVRRRRRRARPARVGPSGAASRRPRWASNDDAEQPDLLDPAVLAAETELAGAGTVTRGTVEAGLPRRRGGLSAVYTASLQSLVDELGRLPGIGPKSAQRLAFHILKIAPEDAARSGRGHRGRQGEHHLVPALLQRRRGRSLHDLQRPPSRRRRPLRRRGSPRHRGRREDPGVPRPLSRPARIAQSHRGRRARPAPRP